MLQLLAKKVGEEFDGVVTGVTNFGLFVQMPRFLVEGLITMDDLGDDWWQVDAQRGTVRGERSGKTYRIGDRCPVRIASVDVTARRLNLVPQNAGGPRGKGKDKNKNKGKTAASAAGKGAKKPQRKRGTKARRR